ncbi:MAG: M1 family aminopeptidase [Ignavibacteriales bacterium]|nr:M1 family aminopeptidase [Ignavibacteriales bacterium]
MKFSTKCIWLLLPFVLQSILYPQITEYLQYKLQNMPSHDFSIVSKSLYQPYDVINYKIDLDVTESFKTNKPVFGGVTDIRIKINYVGLDSIRINAVNLQVDSINLNQTKTSYAYNNNYIALPVTGNIWADTINIKIYYNHTTLSKAYTGYFFNPQSANNEVPTAYTFSTPSDTRYWLPCKDEPGDKATVEMILKVPPDYFAVSNGTLQSIINNSDGTKTFKWREDYPLKVNTIAFSISQYSSIKCLLEVDSSLNRNIAIDYYMWQKDSLNILNNLECQYTNAKRIIDFYSNIFVKYPFDIYSLVSMNKFQAVGMSNQTFTQLSREQFFNCDTTFIMAHEIAHQWWGNFVSAADWKDVWLNEAFADYASYLYLSAVLNKNLFRDINIQPEHLNDFSGKLYDPPYPYYTLAIYTKGSIVLSMLKAVTGDVVFNNIINDIFNTFSYGNYSTEDFLSIVNNRTGSNHQWFFDQWIYDTGYPVYIVNWSSDKGNGNYIVNLNITQVQTNRSVFTMPIELTFSTASGDTVIKVFNDLREQSFFFKFNNEPTQFSFDKNNLIPLKEVQVISDVAKMDIAYRDYFLFQNYPNPFNPSTTIKYVLPKSSSVELKIYDLMGREIRTLVSDIISDGYKEIVWDGRNCSGEQVSSGIYLYRLSAKSLEDGKTFEKSAKLVFMK